jgi:hypothetical protein
MEKIFSKQQELANHPVYSTLTNINGIRHFMESHVFAVWDFMSLLKSLQVHLTCVTLPWKPSPYPAEMVRLINQIVLGEESDVDQSGNPISHFDLYIKAMEEVGASTILIKEFIKTQNPNLIPSSAREFVDYNLKVAMSGSPLEVAASFFYGREKLIPDMFTSIVNVLKEEGVDAPTFIYYLERHIEVDSGEHGPLALKALSYLTANDENLKKVALDSGLMALEMRKTLWDKVLDSYKAD